MLQLGISMAFGLTVGIIMSLVLWLNTKLNLVELFMVMIFVFLSSIVWNFTSGKFTDITLLALMVVWTLARLLIDKWRVFEKILTFTMSTILVLNYYIYLTFIGLRVENGMSITSLIYMIVYLAIIAAVFFIVWLQKVSFFSNTWVKDFFYHEDPKVKSNRTIIFTFLIVLTLVIIMGIYISLGVISETEKAVFYIGFEFFFSFAYIFISFAMLKMLVEYSILSDVSEQEKQHQKELKSFIKMIRAQRHDFNLHLHAVNGLLEAGKFEECREYVNKMVTETEYVNEVLPIYDTSISAMLYAYRSDAESKGIHVDFDITTNLKGLAPEAYEINRIIGNLLQNAIDELSSEKDREYGIKVKIYESSGGSVIDISNKFFGDESEISHFFDYNYSLKKQHEGLGLSTVQRIAESYKGMAYVEMDEDIIHFIVRLPKKTYK
ncbi:MAG: GHKL domain-containing protein [Acutalibacteraceae bacterium]|nr:GHKL domain-containing protein [Acutalibacteraceae bacterium]